jgi:hypothetical protein
VNATYLRTFAVRVIAGHLSPSLPACRRSPRR